VAEVPTSSWLPVVSRREICKACCNSRSNAFSAGGFLDFFDLREELFRSKIGSIDKDEAFALVGLLETFVFLGGGGVVSAKSSSDRSPG